MIFCSGTVCSARAGSTDSVTGAAITAPASIAVPILAAGPKRAACALRAASQRSSGTQPAANRNVYTPPG